LTLFFNSGIVPISKANHTAEVGKMTITWKPEYEGMSDAAIWADAFSTEELTRGVSSLDKSLSRLCRRAIKIKTA